MSGHEGRKKKLLTGMESGRGRKQQQKRDNKDIVIERVPGEGEDAFELEAY